MSPVVAADPSPYNQPALEVSEDHWKVYEQVLAHVWDGKILYGLGGAFAAFFYTGVWRGTKDLDLFIQKKDKERLIEWTKSAGFVDYFDERPYDRGWLYRATRGGVLVDLIWSFANYRSEVKEEWLRRAPEGLLRGQPVRVLSPEELVFAKLYVLQRERCDWPDLLDLLYFKAADLDWNRVLTELDGDYNLLGALLWLFAWLCPGRISAVPAEVKRLFGLPQIVQGAPFDETHAKLLDSRDWFAPLIKSYSKNSMPPPERSSFP